MTVTTLTVTERQTKLETLAAIDGDILAATTVRELRKMVSGVIQNTSKLPKADLLDIIAERTADIRTANRIALETAAIEAAALKERNAELEAAKLSPATPEGYRAALGIDNVETTIEIVLKSLETVADSSKTFDKLLEEVDNIAFRFAFEQQCSYVATSRKANASKLYAKLETRILGLQGGLANENYQTAFTRFKKSLGSIRYQENKSISTDYRERRDAKVSKKTDIYSIPLLDRAIEVLDALADYRDVVIALALLTGRRMVEILATGRFELSDTPDHLLFSGQAKTRGSTAGNATEVFDIPVLASPELILKAIWYLEEGGYRLENTKDVNVKYSKPLSRQMVKWSELAEIEMEFKSLRALYAAVSYKRLGDTGKDDNTYYSEILGHGKLDITTSFSYMIWQVLD